MTAASEAMSLRELAARFRDLAAGTRHIEPGEALAVADRLDAAQAELDRLRAEAAPLAGTCYHCTLRIRGSDPPRHLAPQRPGAIAVPGRHDWTLDPAQARKFSCPGEAHCLAAGDSQLRHADLEAVPYP